MLDAAANEIVLTHAQLPICCNLDMRPDGTVLATMHSDDGKGRFLVSTTFDHAELAADEYDFFLQSGWVGKIEGLFQAHVVALDAWEEDGFAAVSVHDLKEYANLRTRYFRHWRIQSHLSQAVLLGGACGIGFFGLLIPALIASFAGFLTAGTEFELSPELCKKIFAVSSLLFSCFTLWTFVKTPSTSKSKRPSQKQVGFFNSFAVPKAVNYSKYEFHTRPPKYARPLLIGLATLYMLSALLCGLHGLIPFDPAALCSRLAENVCGLSLVFFLAAKMQLPLGLLTKCTIRINDLHFVIENSYPDLPIPIQLGRTTIGFDEIDSLETEQGLWNSTRLNVQRRKKQCAIEGLKIRGVQITKVRNDTPPVFLLSSICGFERAAAEELKEVLLRALIQWQTKKNRSEVSAESPKPQTEKCLI